VLLFADRLLLVVREWSDLARRRETASLGPAELVAAAIQVGLVLLLAWTWQAAWVARGRNKVPRVGRRPLEGWRSRMVWWLVCGFGLAMLSAHSWRVYLDQLERAPAFRSWMMGPPLRRSFRASTPSAEDRRWDEAARRADRARQLWGTGEIDAAHEEFQQAMRLYAELSASAGRYRAAAEDRWAELLNNSAWMLVTAKDRNQWRPGDAVRLAREAVKLRPEEGNYWNTLAVAQVREGRDKAARESFDRSMSLRSGGDAHDWFFLAILEQHAGHGEAAEAWYAKASEQRSSDPGAGDPDELWRFDIEAAQVLGRPAPAAPSSDATSAFRGRALLRRGTDDLHERRSLSPPREVP
jgi:tetratricopeptide (TPR) repeat protein